VHALTRQGWRAGALALLLGGALAPCDAHSVFSINEPWVRVAPDGRSAEVYMRITSSEGARLVSATSPAAKRIAIHAPGRGKGEAAEVALPAKQLVILARGQYRIELTGLARKPKLGDRIPMTIAVRGDDGSVQEIPLEAEVRLHSPTEDEGGPEHVHGRAH
jgi:periplasmic copper chaperone A